MAASSCSGSKALPNTSIRHSSSAHLNASGRSPHVEVGDRPATTVCVPRGSGHGPEVLDAGDEGRAPKGDVLAVARWRAGIQAASHLGAEFPSVIRSRLTAWRCA